MDLGWVGNNRIAFDQVVAAEQIRDQAKVFAVSIDTTGINVAGGGIPGAAAGDAGLTREQIEKKAIRTLVNDDALWGLAAKGDEFAALFFDLKEAVRQGRSSEELAELITHSPLVEEIRISKATAPAPSSSELTVSGNPLPSL